MPETLDAWFERSDFDEAEENEMCFILIQKYQGHCLDLSERSLVFSSAPSVVSCWIWNFTRETKLQKMQKSHVQPKLTSLIPHYWCPSIGECHIIKGANSRYWECAMKSAVWCFEAKVGGEMLTMATPQLPIWNFHNMLTWKWSEKNTRLWGICTHISKGSNVTKGKVQKKN